MGSFDFELLIIMRDDLKGSESNTTSRETSKQEAAFLGLCGFGGYSVMKEVGGKHQHKMSHKAIRPVLIITS